jgi:hypothetical protein
MHSPSASCRTEATSVHPIAIRPPSSISVASETSVRCIPHPRGPAQKPRVSTQAHSSTKLNLSVTSETSVRCIPYPRVHAQKPRASTQAHSSTKLNLCDLRDLCAMLSPIREFPHRSHERPPNRIRVHQAQSLWPPRPLCDAFPISRVPAQKPRVSTQSHSSTKLNPLCDLRDLCAMHSPFRVFPHGIQSVHPFPRGTKKRRMAAPRRVKHQIKSRLIHERLRIANPTKSKTIQAMMPETIKWETV